jgi:predicted transcriptional regulator
VDWIGRESSEEAASGQGLAEAEEGKTMNDELGRQVLEQIRELQTTANTCCYTLIAIAVMVGVIVWRLHS